MTTMNPHSYKYCQWHSHLNFDTHCASYSSDLLTSDSAEFMLQLGENDQGKSKYCCKESKGRKR